LGQYRLSNFPRRTEKGESLVVNCLSASCLSADQPELATVGDACPGLFYQTPAQDGFLVRIRVPGGRLNAAQAKYLAAIAEDYGSGQVWLTNRANLQLRLNQATMPEAILQTLQDLGLAAKDEQVDHLRNIMASPTAGIDRTSIIDVMPLVRTVDEYLSSHPELAPLSAKFSIGFDGGEQINLRDRRNDIWFIAEAVDQLRVKFGETDTGIIIKPQDVVDIIAAIGQIYLTIAPQILAEGVRRKSQKPRWQEVVDYLGRAEVCQRIGRPIMPDRQTLERATCSTAPIGIHPQNNNEYYVGLVIPMGRLQSQQLKDLAELATTYGAGELRITPWQNILIPHIKSPSAIQTQLHHQGYSTDPNHPNAGLVACTGLPGCAAAFTDSQTDALRVSEMLSESLSGKLDRPIQIHISACAKGCAQPYASDIALMGIESGNYDLYIRSGNQVFGQLLHQNIAPDELPQVIQAVLSC
jgi:ferredoxin-nitrite reductase